MQSFNREDYIYKLEKENTELQQKWLDESYKKAKLVGQLTYAKTIIQDLLDNSDEYARQRAIDFLSEVGK